MHIINKVVFNQTQTKRSKVLLFEHYLFEVIRVVFGGYKGPIATFSQGP